MSTDIYYWRRSFVLRSTEFSQRAADKPMRRPSLTVIASAAGPFEIKIVGQSPQRTDLAVLAPELPREQLQIDGHDTFIFDVGVASAVSRHALARLPRGHLPEIAPAVREAVLERLSEAAGCRLETGAVPDLHDAVYASLWPDVAPLPLDPRLEGVLAIIEELPRDEILVGALAARAGLSPSRLRSLFQRELGCSVASYLRWVTAWKTAESWSPGTTLTQVAHAAGFHDLAHASRTFSELFGQAPSRIARADGVILHRVG